MIGVGSKVRLKSTLARSTVEYWEEKGVHKEFVYTVIKCVELPSGLLCLLGEVNHILYEDDLEDVWEVNLEKILE